MTWHTPYDDRILEGAEAEFYKTAVNAALDELWMFRESDEVPFETGDRIFDNASFNQKVFLLHQVTKALLEPSDEPLPLTNVTEAAAYFPFEVLSDRLHQEILSEQHPDEIVEEYRNYFRSATWKVFVEYLQKGWLEDSEENGALPGEAEFNEFSDDYELWGDVIDSMVRRIFWDFDWVFTSTHPQVLDGIEEELGNLVGIENDYFTARLPKVTDEEAEEYSNKIRVLTSFQYD